MEPKYATTDTYYEELQNNIRTNNSFNKAHGIKNVAEMKASLDSDIRGTVKR